MTLGNFLIFFNGIYIYISKLPDLVLYLGNVPLHGVQVCKLFLFVLKGIVWRDFIFVPHIGNLGFPVLFQLLHLAFQTVALLIQKGNLAGKFITLFEKGFVTGVLLILYSLPALQLGSRLRLLFP